MPQIVIEIDKNGEITLDAQGFKGQLCHTKLTELQAILGKAIASKKKAEFYQDDKVRIEARSE